LFLIYNEKYYYASSLNKLYEVFLCACTAGSHVNEQLSISKMQFVNCMTVATILYTTLNANICS